MPSKAQMEEIISERGMYLDAIKQEKENRNNTSLAPLSEMTLLKRQKMLAITDQRIRKYEEHVGKLNMKLNGADSTGSQLTMPPGGF